MKHRSTKKLVHECSQQHQSIHSSPKVDQRPISIHWWINKVWYVHTVENYLAIQRNEIPMHRMAWMKLENKVLGKKKPVTALLMLQDSI